MIKSSAILITALIICRILRRRAAAERHIVWVAAIGAAGLLPLLTFVLPAWRPVLTQRIVTVLPSVSASAANANFSKAASVAFHAQTLEPAIAAMTRVWWILWLAGFVAGALVLLTGFIRRRQWALRAEPVSNPIICLMTREIANELGSRRSIRVLQSVHDCMPMTWGVVQPRVILPKCADNWAHEQKRIVVAHELAHVHRGDWLFQMFAQVACLVYWFNPLFWLAGKRLYRESEHACDDVVINLGVDAQHYAAHLLEIARALHKKPVWTTALAMARPSTLERRFAALLNPASDRRAASARTRLFAAAAALLIAVPLAALDAVPPRARDMNGAASAGPVVIQYTTPPLYSDAARSRGIEGVVSIEARIGIDGTIKHLRVVKGLGYGLDENALLAVGDWRFLPATRGGQPVDATTQIDVEFNLRNAEINELIANDMATRLGPGVVPPQVVHRVEPGYGLRMNAQGQAGGVILDAVIPEDGIPKIVRVIQSLDWELDEKAINALKQWRFSPAMKDGMPVKVRMNIAINFSPQPG